MKFQKMEFVLCADVAEEACFALSPATAANYSEINQPTLSPQDQELLEFLSSDQFSFEAMQARWQ